MRKRTEIENSHQHNHSDKKSKYHHDYKDDYHHDTNGVHKRSHDDSSSEKAVRPEKKQRTAESERETKHIPNGYIPNGFKISDYLGRDARAQTATQSLARESFPPIHPGIASYLEKDNQYQQLQRQTFTFKKTTEAELRDLLHDIDYWQTSNFEKISTSKDPIYTARIKEQYRQLFDLVSATTHELHYLPNPPEHIAISKLNSHEYAKDQVKIDGLGYMKDPFYVMNPDPLTIEMANHFFARLKTKLIQYNQNNQNKIEFVKPAKNDTEKEHSLYKMNVGFRSLVCTTDKTVHHFMVIAPSGYGTPQQVKLWSLMKDVVKEMNETVSDCTIILQTSYNLDRRSTYKKKSVSFNSIFDQERQTQVNSYFDELIQELLHNIGKVNEQYKVPQITPKACSEKKLAQFTIKLKAFYDTVGTQGVENAILGPTILEEFNKQERANRRFQKRLPCKECMKALPAYHALEETKPLKELEHTQTTVLTTEELNRKKTVLLGDIKRLEASIKQLRETSEKYQTQEQNQEALNQIAKINKRCTDLDTKKQNYEKEYMELVNKEQSIKSKKQTLTKRYSFLMSPYRSDSEWMRPEKSREKEYEAMMENNIKSSR